MLKKAEEVKKEAKRATTKKETGIIKVVPEKFRWRDKDYNASKILADLEAREMQEAKNNEVKDEEAGYVLELMLEVDKLSSTVESLVSRVELLETRRKLIR